MSRKKWVSRSLFYAFWGFAVVAPVSGTLLPGTIGKAIEPGGNVVACVSQLGETLVLAGSTDCTATSVAYLGSQITTYLRQYRNCALGDVACRDFGEVYWDPGIMHRQLSAGAEEDLQDLPFAAYEGKIWNNKGEKTTIPSGRCSVAPDKRVSAVHYRWKGLADEDICTNGCIAQISEHTQVTRSSNRARERSGPNPGAFALALGTCGYSAGTCVTRWVTAGITTTSTRSLVFRSWLPIAFSST